MGTIRKHLEKTINRNILCMSDTDILFEYEKLAAEKQGKEEKLTPNKLLIFVSIREMCQSYFCYLVYLLLEGSREDSINSTKKYQINYQHKTKLPYQTELFVSPTY